MSGMLEGVNRNELAEILKRSRERLSPTDVGLPDGGRRRVPGLRREEVAQLAGVSVDYVVRLEQARGPHPSDSVLAALARALQLGDAERNELFHLAGNAPPLPGQMSLLVRPSVHRLLDRLSDLPTMVISAKADILAWNDLAAALLGDWSAISVRERNIIWQRFLGDHSRMVFTDEEYARNADHSVACLRDAAARYPGDADLSKLVSELRHKSPEFAQLWRETRSAPWRSQHKTVDHPSLGKITLDCDSLHLPESDQTMIVYSAEPHSPAAEALALLRVIGTQELSTESR